MELRNIFNKFLQTMSPNFDSLDGINAIPNKQSLLQAAKGGSLEGTILAKLQKKATEHKKNGNMDLAIACLEKSFYIMLNSDYYWSDYAERYIKFLKNDRQFEKARDVEKIISNMESAHSNDVPEYIVSAKQLRTDLVEASYPALCDSETAKYRGRIYSISGKDKRFPILSNIIKNCELDFYPFVLGISSPSHCPKTKEIEYSNRPFVDDRTPEEKERYDDILKKHLSTDENEEEYYWLYEHLPEIAPKSLSGYSRMKSSKSKNFMKIVSEAEKLGYKIKI